ncbi:ARM repeat-containing protein [Microstroma glucosiphilum]|uniref:ARM repeat-containing protein n=1 Tax=Pseudomicrostroma glucosiphilum TaxID=1684307 RepID=A0A316U5R2_9BASI|nr:ARM repeat-containing protein [Pseudomicrostroma glucosiphilum]PWN20569.1 ARM repeat-containing protein [Pseudomicrostroma glucosiphilum]
MIYPHSQEASIILQQQLKSGSAERQTAIIRAIAPHLLVLSEDKHGNFLVQRAIGINASVAWKLKGSYARLALSQYGCHVVQRILDEDEPLKIAVVEELLSQNLLETLTSRNSVHVWAKALEVKWSSEKFREKVFDVINAAMRGHWAYTAMQETGSIVVQNLFESAQGPEKKDCIEEILHKLPECAANQWGVWVVQHIIEHGDDDSRTVAFEKLLGEAAMLSMSQFGQKAIMTALKSRDAHFIGGYLDLLCDGPNASGSGGEGSGQSSVSANASSGRRSMLVDIASTPQGLQIMTQLLTTISRDDRERIIKAVRKNSVFLKGTKTGLKVHQMCERARAFTGY